MSSRLGWTQEQSKLEDRSVFSFENVLCRSCAKPFGPETIFSTKTDQSFSLERYCAKKIVVPSLTYFISSNRYTEHQLICRVNLLSDCFLQVFKLWETFDGFLSFIPENGNLLLAVDSEMRFKIKIFEKL